MAWWGRIQGGVSERATTAEIWDAIRSLAQQEGLKLPSDMFLQVNTMRAQAAALRNASERLGRAGASAPLTSEFIAGLPYARTATEQTLAPRYHVRVNYVARRGAETEHSYITLDYTGGLLPSTVGQLYQDATTMTASLVDTYGGELIDLAAIEIGAY
jgi:hypothetical protein